jgi:signal transduction histidine kinase
LQHAAMLLFQQVKLLGIPTFGCGFNIWDEDRKEITAWMAGENRIQPPFKTPCDKDIFFHIQEAAQRGESLFVATQAGQVLENHYKYMAGIPVFKDVMNKMAEAGVSLPNYQIMHCAFFSHGYLMFISYEPVHTAHDIFKRFAKVFEQTYTRFLDLQKAEAQAKEAQVEAALEKVRSRSLAMHTANELGEVVKVIVEKLQGLGVVLDANGVVLCTYFADSKNVLHWIVSPDYSMAGSYLLPYFDHPIFNNTWHSKESGDEYFSEAFSVEEKNSFFEYAFEHSDYKHFPEDLKQWMFQNDKHILSFAWQKNSAILIPSHTGVVPNDAEKAILVRFAKVFEQSYTRFLDLQKAEAQAREAKIETALERIRSRTMAMQKSEELTDVAGLLFEQVSALDIKTWTAGFNVWSDDNNSYIDYITSPSGGFIEPYTVHTERAEALTDISNARKSGVEFDVLFVEGEKIKQLYLALTKLDEKQYEIMLQDGVRFPSQQYEHFVFGSKVSLMFITYEPAPEAHDIFKRFGKVFEQTYTRFLDLQKAEAQARESQIEAALERVRSRTLAMQKSDELAETAAVLFQQLILLGIEPNRLYITIIKDAAANAEFWITDEDGTKVSAVFETNMNNNSSFQQMYEGWKEKNRTLVIDLKGVELKQYFEYLTSIHVPFKGGLTQNRRLQYIAYFNKGFIGMASPDEQPQQTIFLLERFAAVFNLTFTRFNDLQVAEAHAIQAEEDLVKLQTEKKRAEVALNELKATQKQLIQAEKMASLGELTAGIAHEIQNPLNFVTNFSDLNNELIVELKHEIENKNFEEAIAIADDIQNNEIKINHHGKRADSIVKGMLQHSRSNSGEMQSTDVNKLADEYLRLSYHGLRAKDKTFNATLNTSFDSALGLVLLNAPDIGRVLLNLFNNAFYAVDEKKKQLGDGYEPVVTVATKNLIDKIVISVSDNGNGIPQKIVEKIFQPFFTTKPTGQGTGLGLSLAYDIVKAHGGELKAETREDEGTAFFIQLPVL